MDVTDNHFIGDFFALNAERLADGFRHLLLADRTMEIDGLCRIKEPVNMLFQPEYPAIVGPDSLKHTVAIEETVIENRHLGPGIIIVFGASGVL